MNSAIGFDLRAKVMSVVLSGCLAVVVLHVQDGRGGSLSRGNAEVELQAPSRPLPEPTKDPWADRRAQPSQPTPMASAQVSPAPAPVMPRKPIQGQQAEVVRLASPYPQGQEAEVVRAVAPNQAIEISKGEK